MFKMRRVLQIAVMVLLISSMMLSTVQPVEAAGQTTTLSVSSKKDFVNQIYKALLKKDVRFSLRYKGNWKDLYQNDLDKIFAQVYAKHSTSVSDDYDYMKGNVERYSLKISSDGTISKFTFDVKYRESKAQTQKVNKMVASALKSLKLSKSSNYTKVKKIHDYIVNRVQYDQKYSKYTAYNAMVNKKAVCQGYALLFYKMAIEAGVPCRVVTSDTHAWNIVKMGKKWYHVDTTWDDPISSKPVLRYDYFLKGTKSMNKEHNMNAEFKTKTFKQKFPISSTNYKK